MPQIVLKSSPWGNVPSYFPPLIHTNMCLLCSVSLGNTLLSIDINCCVLFWLCSERGSSARWSRGAGDDDRKVHPGPPAGADRDRNLRHLQLQPDAVSARLQLHRHTGVWEGSEGHLCEWNRSRQSSPYLGVNSWCMSSHEGVMVFI